MNETVIGVVGAGDVAWRHMEGLRRVEGVKVVAVAEPNAERREAFAREYRPGTAVGDYRLLLTMKEVNTLLLLTPHDLHVSMTLEALEAGKDVICEKPMAPVLADCDVMLDAAGRRGRQLFITHSLRTELFYQVVSRRMREESPGRLLGASFRWFTDEESRLNDPGHWKGTKKSSGGGVLIDGGCHVADLANAFLGRARRVTALASKLVARRDAVAEDTAAFVIEYESGALASVYLSFTAGSSLRKAGGFAAGLEADIFGSSASFQGGYSLRDGVFPRWCTERRTGRPDVAHPYDGKAAAGDIDVAILRALRGEAPPPVTALDARNAVAVVDAAYQSLGSGSAAEVDWRDE